MAQQPITGVPSSYRAPISAVEVLFGQGASTASAGPRSAIYAMPMLSTGTWTAGTVYEVRNEQDAKDGAGVGSPLHRAVRMHLRANKRGKLYALPVAETTGGVPSAADGTITITMGGGNPTATAVLKATIAGEDVSVRLTTSDTPTTAGDKLEGAINEKTHLPCTASNSTGTVTLTARLKGTSQGDGTTGVIRFRSEVEAGKGVTVADSGAALGLGTGNAGVEGSTAEAAQLATALLSIDASRYYYIGTSTWDTTGLTNLQSHISSKSEPMPGHRSQGVCGYTGTLASAQTAAIARNYERLVLVTQPLSEHDVAELTANTVAVLQKRHETDSAYNFDNYSESDWLIKPVHTEADWPTDDDINDAITDGVMVIASGLTSSRPVMYVNTRSKTAAGGTTDDFRATEGHRISVMDEFADTWVLRDKQDLAGKKLMAHPLDADGNPDINAAIPNDTITNYIYEKARKGLIDEFGPTGANLLQDIPAWLDSLSVNIDPNNSGRIEAGASGRVIDLAHQSTIRLAETNPG